jgi:hypothetical protein
MKARNQASLAEAQRLDGVEACQELIKSLRDRLYKHQRKVLPLAKARAFCTPRLETFHDAARRYEQAARAAEAAWLELAELAAELREGGFTHLHGNDPINGEAGGIVLLLAL